LPLARQTSQYTGTEGPMRYGVPGLSTQTQFFLVEGMGPVTVTYRRSC